MSQWVLAGSMRVIPQTGLTVQLLEVCTFKIWVVRQGLLGAFGTPFCGSGASTNFCPVLAGLLHHLLPVHMSQSHAPPVLTCPFVPGSHASAAGGCLNQAGGKGSISSSGKRCQLSARPFSSPDARRTCDSVSSRNSLVGNLCTWDP